MPGRGVIAIGSFDVQAAAGPAEARPRPASAPRPSDPQP